MHRPGAGVNNTVVKDASENNDRAAFIAANTENQSTRLVPEICLRLASENMAIWRINDEQREAAGVPLFFWAFAWASGQALARYILDHPSTVAGRKLLDMGAGSGLEAIAAAMAEAEVVGDGDECGVERRRAVGNIG